MDLKLTLNTLNVGTHQTSLTVSLQSRALACPHTHTVTSQFIKTLHIFYESICSHTFKKNELKGHDLFQGQTVCLSGWTRHGEGVGVLEVSG